MVESAPEPARREKLPTSLPTALLARLRALALPAHFPPPGKALLLGLALAISFSWALSSGDSRSASNESQLIQQLLSEQRRLEEQVRSLQARASDVTSINISAPAHVDNSPITERTLALDGSERDDPFFGPKDSQTIMMVFSDFQCKLCRDFNLQTLPRIRAEFADTAQLKVIYRDFPLANNSHAQEAAIFASCAGEQGSYWKAFDVLKAHPDEIASGKLTSLIKLLPSLNQDTMNQCLRSVRYEKEISLDQAQGIALGAKGAPSMFIGKLGADRFYHGVFVRGAQPYPVIQEQIAGVLKR